MIIEAETLTYSYDDNLAVDHISFSVDKGEVLGFLGPNGAGKTTTTKMLTGQLIPQEGWARIMGIDISQDPKKVHERIGVCFEEKNLYPRLTVRENLDFFAGLFGISPDLDGLMKRVDLTKWADDRAETLSKGLQQRVMFARSLINDPDILFLDEPTSGLDPISADAIRQIIVTEKKKGKTIFLTTHNMMEADKLSDRVAFINEGKIVALDTPENLKLKLGKRTLRVKTRTKKGFEEETLPLDDPKTPERTKNLLETKEVATIHTQEATLEEVFIKLTGRKLEQ
ncbi:MAG: ABC transporter ATP-binding protein [Theionarchaea archaeon]|nr:ABC transporter ATP-binding protein [Theionarchaea archaeon]MBU7001696.1 ABC transporter ATP-binding protein [Theionarchaea archaeon]MBU7021722.1 ABC transporter ATP-binding protein [Theionarchaea archaeon]MBU7035757.1 ABC transporter ATP-binding protein [Theionarchaea archaeon]MBU7041467.1 ABC transporter ATP-binding protein [Theionarchaea archaeon]